MRVRVREREEGSSFTRLTARVVSTGLIDCPPFLLSFASPALSHLRHVAMYSCWQRGALTAASLVACDAEVLKKE